MRGAGDAHGAAAGRCAITSDYRPGMPTVPTQGQTAEQVKTDKAECKERADAGLPPFGERLGTALVVPGGGSIASNYESTYAACMRAKGYK